MLDQIHQRKETPRERVLRFTVVPLVVAVAIVVGWPVALGLMIRRLRSKPQAPYQPEEEKVFAVEAAHLCEPLSLDAIEQRERVEDPLSAVPALPFGHLHSAWCQWKGGVQPGDQVWSFEAHWTTRFGAPCRYQGYAAVRNGVPDVFFTTVREFSGPDHL